MVPSVPVGATGTRGSLVLVMSMPNSVDPVRFPSETVAVMVIVLSSSVALSAAAAWRASVVGVKVKAPVVVL